MLGNIVLLTVARRLPFFLTPEFIARLVTFVGYLLVALVYHSAVVTVPVATYLGFLALFSGSGGILRSGAAAAATGYSSSSRPVVVTLKLPETVQKVVVNAIRTVSETVAGGGTSSSSFWSSSSQGGGRSSGKGGGELEWKLILPSELWKITASGVAFLVILYICEKLQVERVKKKKARAASRVGAGELQQTLIDGHFVLGGQQRNSINGGEGSMVKGRLRREESSPIAQTMVKMYELKAKVTQLCKQLWPEDQQPALDSFNALVKATAKLAEEVGLQDLDAASATDPDKLGKLINAVDNTVM
jgi:hypothetical protein